MPARPLTTVCALQACSPRRHLAFYSHTRRTDSPSVAAALPLHSARNFGASLAASVLATLLTQPVDVVRTRLQLRAVEGATTWRAGTVLLKGLADVARVEGALTLFTGALSRVVKRSVSTAITWTMFEEAMRTST